MKRWNAIAAQAALAVALFAIVPASFAEQPAGHQGPQPETEMMGPGMGRGMMREGMMGPGMMGQGMGRGGMMGWRWSVLPSSDEECHAAKHNRPRARI